MGRDIQLSIIRGSTANMPQLNDGEFYLATDTGILYVGLIGLNFKIGVGMATVEVNGNLNPTHYIEPNADGSVPVTVSTLPLAVNAAQESGGNLASVATSMVNGSAKTQTVNGAGVVQDVTAKGVQGAFASATQALKDSGRVIRTFSASFTASTTEAMVTLTPNTDGVLGSTNTSFSITAGKRFRLQAIYIACFNVTAAIHACQVNLRMSSTGAVTTASPVIQTVAVSTAAATINLSASQAQSVPDGLELSGNMQFGISQIGVALAGQTVVLVGYEY